MKLEEIRTKLIDLVMETNVLSENYWNCKQLIRFGSLPAARIKHQQIHEFWGGDDRISSRNVRKHRNLTTIESNQNKMKKKKTRHLVFCFYLLVVVFLEQKIQTVFTKRFESLIFFEREIHSLYIIYIYEMKLESVRESEAEAAASFVYGSNLDRAPENWIINKKIIISI